MTNSEYWQKRMLALEAAIYADNSEYIKNAEKQYQKAIRETERDIRVWYSRFATSEGITYADAKKRLKTDELADFKLTLEEYIEKGKENAISGEWTRVLESASARYHVSRLEALQLQMRQHVEVLMTGERKGIYDAVKSAYEKSYYKSIFEVQSGFGVGATFAKLDTASVEKVLAKPWTADGTNFSERIWGKYCPQLVQELNNTLSQAIIRGQNPNDFASDIAKKFNVKKHQAENLLRTEAAYFQSLAECESMKELGVTEYEIVATLDSRTTEICRSMDGKHFKLSDLKPGVTAPPFHCRCRSCTAPYFDDEFEKDTERIARDEDGESYYVPSDMKYDEWYETFVEGNGDSGKYSTDSENARHWTRESGKMAKSTVDWSDTTARTYTKAEKTALIDYAASKNVGVKSLNEFDGDEELFKEQIDTLREMLDEFGITREVSVNFSKTMSDDDFAETSANKGVIKFNTKALRNREVTNRILNEDNVLASTDIKGIAAHEVGHLMPRKIREKSLDIAKQAYYNIYKENISTVDIINYLKKNVSIYSTDIDEIYVSRPHNEKYYQEILPEVLAQNITKPTDFSREFVKVIKEVVKQ